MSNIQRSSPTLLLDAARSKDFGMVHKLTSYFPEYDFCLAKYKDRPIRILEIGISKGGSLAMWLKYFSDAEMVVGIDIDQACLKFEKANIKVYIGDQADVSFLERVSREAGPFDIIIDDGGHMMSHNIISFETLFPLLSDGGVYVIEDLHTSYWPAFQNYPQTTVSFLKNRIDDLTFWASRHSRAGGLPWLKRKGKGALRRMGIRKTTGPEVAEPRNLYESSIRSIYFADSIAFIFKGRVEKIGMDIKL